MIETIITEIADKYQSFRSGCSRIVLVGAFCVVSYFLSLMFCLKVHINFGKHCAKFVHKLISGKWCHSIGDDSAHYPMLRCCVVCFTRSHNSFLRLWYKCSKFVLNFY